MKAEDLNIDIKFCPCCKGTFDNNKIHLNNEVDEDILCIPCYGELERHNHDWQSDC